MKRILLITVLIATLAGCNTPQGTARVPLSTTAMIAQAGTLISVQRANAGVPAPVVQNAALQAAAQAHADDLARSGGLSHTGSDGSALRDRLAAARYPACFAAENIARGQPDVSSVIAEWTGSRGHYENMVNAAAQQFGFARAGDIWVLVLAQPC